MKIFLSYIVISILSGYLLAQDKDEFNRLSQLSLDELLEISIISVSRYHQAISEAPATARVITSREIRERGYRDLPDILKDIGGIDIIDNAGRFGDFYTIRGIQGNDRFLVLLNGVKINPPSGRFLSTGNSISIRFVDRVEIVYGPASAVYGADAFSGIINIITKNDFKKNTAEFYSEFGNNNLFDLGIAGQYNFAKDLSVHFWGRYVKSDGPNFIGRDPAYEIIKEYAPPFRPDMEQPLSDHNIFTSIDYKDLSLKYYRKYFKEGNGLGMNPELYFMNKDHYWELTTDLLSLSYDSEFYQGIFKGEVKYIRNSMGDESKFIKTTVPGDYTSHFTQYMMGTDNAVQASLSYSKNMEDLELIGGIEFEYIHSLPPYANDEVLGNSFKYEGTNKEIIDAQLTIHQQRYAGFFQLMYSPHDKIDIIMGGRADYFSRYDFTLNPRAGIIYKPSKDLSLKFLFGTAFQAPSLFYEFEQFGSPVVVMHSVNEIRKSYDPGWKLKNQKLRTYEINLVYKLSNKIRIDLSAYYNYLSNMIERVVYADSVYNKYLDIYTRGIRNQNIGKQKIFGTDLFLTAKINSHFDGYIAYSYLEAHSETNGMESDIPRIARHKIWAGLTFRNVFDLLNIHPSIRWSDKINNVNTAYFPSGKQNGYLSVDLFITTQDLTDNFDFTLKIENLLNKNIFHPGLFRQQQVYVPQIPQEKRNIKLGIEFRL